MKEESSEVVPRVILLGASNLTLALPMLIDNLVAAFPTGVDVLVAAGHGRSYGSWSRVLFRELPRIEGCDLWKQVALPATAVSPTFALFTDIGNDLIYGASVELIVSWVEACLQRLIDQRAEIVFTLLPVASIERLSAWRYHLTRTFFFPASGNISWQQMKSRVHELNDRIQQMAQRSGAQVVEPLRDWYGFDPIHIRRSRRSAVWQHFFSHWPGWPASSQFKSPPFGKRLQYWRLAPAVRRKFGRQIQTPQPALILPGGSQISLY